MSVSTDTLDHIVHLVPPNALSDAVASFTALGFRVIPGGTHADGLTSNALIVFKDGVYIELITFNVPDPTTTAHRWGKEKPGWIDWALLGLSDRLSEILNARAEKEKSDVEYTPTVPGGRERPDGRVLRWRITAPVGDKHKPGSVPFFCGDTTPREWRVPLDPPSNAEHDNGAVGIALLRLLSTPEELDKLQARITTVLGTPKGKDGAWTLRTPAGGAPKLLVSVPQDEKEQRWLEEKGRDVAFFEIGLRVAGKTTDVTVHDTPFARLSFEA
ncbi:hypothetical protein EXIGLDRAFT_831723 [Exidia glandulosa HHB12029]|uniref:Glyoxalase-like domain-containing protein n=1 Tax=Exidia glandulosa HHB12029 TaxID=1314781 RepID=A0A165MEV8_EXIGL|nr:hypothetical protein EXIGLDRAFT_831723 [Exidia glandulosa HHB12029]